MGLAQSLTTEPAPSGGIGYGGATYAVHDNLLVFAAKDGRLYASRLPTSRAACTLAPDDIPTSKPSWRPSQRVIA